MTKDRRAESATEGTCAAGPACGAAALPETGNPAADEMAVRRTAMEEIHETLQGLVETVEATGRLVSFLGGKRKAAAKGDSADDPLEKVAQRIEEQVRVYTADFHRWQKVNRRVPARLRAVFAGVSFVAVFSLGVLVEQRWQPIPVRDETGGWKTHVWQHYGRQVADCYRGIGEKAADGSCVIIVRQKR